MTKIEERATEYFERSEYHIEDYYELRDALITQYVSGATDQISEDAKWICENVGDSVAVDFLKAMKE